MHTSIVVVDEFFNHQDALRLREAGLRASYPQQQGAFPGRNSLERLNIEGLPQMVSQLVGEPLQPISPLESHGKFRITLGADKGVAKVHIDNAHWSGILYLSRPEDCRGGTEFFRHLKTGTDRAPITVEEVRSMGLKAASDVHPEIIEKDGMDDSQWERTMQVPMRFNRLLLLRPWLWHTAGEAFGDHIENGRLVYLMFFARG